LTSGAEPRHLLDVNLLIALAWPQHVHHAQAHAWFNRVGHSRWATCPLTQLGFVRISSNPKIVSSAVSPREALVALQRMTALPGHAFWPDDVSPAGQTEFAALSLVGHRQVTDAYLLALCRRHKGRLATLDRGLAELCGSAAERAKLIELIA
jgi:toxin-antitoxin system PIN domain toxin